MNVRHFFTTAILCISFADSAAAQMGLRWQFAKGQVFDVERTVTQKQAVELKGKMFTQVRSSTWHVRLEVKAQQGANFTLAATLVDVTHKIAGVTDAPMLDPKLHEKMKGSVFTLDVTPRGQIVKLRGYDDFLKRLGGGDEARLAALRATFPEAAVHEALADLFGPLPERDLAWQRAYVEPIPHFGSLRVTAHYLHAGAKKGRDLIHYTLATKYEPPAKDERMILFRVVSGTIDAEKASGAIAFDNAAGRLLEHDRTMLLRGKLTIEAMDRREPLEFTSENVVKIRVKK